MMESLPKPPFWKSIVWRIQLWYAVALALAIAGMMVGFWKYERESRVHELDMELRNLVRPILPKLVPVGLRGGRLPPSRRPEGREGSAVREGRERGEPPPARVSEQLRDSYWAVAWDPQGKEVYREGKEPPEWVRWSGAEVDTELATQQGHRYVRFLGPARRVVEVGAPLDFLDDEMAGHAWRLAGLGAALFTGGLLFGWSILRWGLRPVREIGHTAREIADGDLSRRIDASRAGTELHELAQVLNHTFGELEKGIRQRERFTADASHELRTPLAVVLGQIQQLLSKPRSEEQYREGLAVAEKAAKRMKRLVEELLELARLDAAAEPKREPVDLAEVARSVASEMRGLLAKRDVSLQLDLRPAPTEGDRGALVRVVTNLLGNAAQHNPVGVRIRIGTGTDDRGSFVSVEDDGQGIPDEARERLFERFYRADAARTNHHESGNSGLGLAICDAIVRQHGGSIRVESEIGKGSRFTARLPRSASLDGGV